MLPFPVLVGIIVATFVGFGLLWDHLQTRDTREDFHRAVVWGEQLPSRVKPLDEAIAEVLQERDAEVVSQWENRIVQYKANKEWFKLRWANANLCMAFSPNPDHRRHAEKELSNPYGL